MYYLLLDLIGGKSSVSSLERNRVKQASFFEKHSIDSIVSSLILKSIYRLSQVVVKSIFLSSSFFCLESCDVLYLSSLWMCVNTRE